LGLGATLLGDDWEKDDLEELAKEVGASASTPELLHLSEVPSIRDAWVEYSAFDTQATWQLYEKLAELLAAQPLLAKNENGERSLLDLYLEVHGPLAQVLVEMEEAGLPVDSAVLEDQSERVAEDLLAADKQFRSWLSGQYEKACPDDVTLHEVPLSITWTYPKLRYVICGCGPKTIAKTSLWGLGLGGEAGQGGRAKRRGSSSPSLAEVVSSLAGRCPQMGAQGCGTAFEAVGQAGCEALFALSKVMRSWTRHCPTKLLQEFRNHEDGRIYPGLFKSKSGPVKRSDPDPNRLRAFEREYPGVSSIIAGPRGSSTLVSASYVDLPTTLLMHLAQEPSLLTHLQDGADVHAVTAYNMYPDIREEVDNGFASLQQHVGNGNGVPCVQELFCAEYEDAKQLNRLFSRVSAASWWDDELAAIKPHVLKKWHEAYPQFTRWEVDVVADMLSNKHFDNRLGVATLRGRSSHVSDSSIRWACMAVQQGSMSDLLQEAMLRVGSNEGLKALGFRLILQDFRSASFVLEGPADAAEEALTLLEGLLRSPFIDGLKLAAPLQVEGWIGFPR